MNSDEYEELVADVVTGLSISKNSKIYRNRRFNGIRQPGKYEIDIACEMEIDEKLSFFIIVECKNWTRAIDRPQIQKLIQTRDAINAHKAAFASPVGFTKEAIEVAETHGIALWVVTKGVFNMICAGGGGYFPSVSARIDSEIRKSVSDYIDYQNDYLTRLDYPKDIYNPNVKSNKYAIIPNSWLVYDGSARINYFEPIEDPILTLLIEHILTLPINSNELTTSLDKTISFYISIFVESGLDLKTAKEFVNCIVTKAEYPTHEPVLILEQAKLEIDESTLRQISEFPNETVGINVWWLLNNDVH